MADQFKQTVIRMTELHRKLGQVIRKVARSDEHFVVEKGGLPVVVLLSMPEYEKLMGEVEREERVRRFRQLAREVGEAFEQRGLTEEDALEGMEEAREKVYKKYYGNP